MEISQYPSHDPTGHFFSEADESYPCMPPFLVHFPFLQCEQISYLKLSKMPVCVPGPMSGLFSEPVGSFLLLCCKE